MMSDSKSFHYTKNEKENNLWLAVLDLWFTICLLQVV